MNKRAGNINQEQKDILIEYMKKHPKLIDGKFCAEFTYKDAQKLWNKISETLNAIPNGGNKTWKQWRKVWQDIRTKTKSKKAKLNREMQKTGGGSASSETFSNTEVVVLDMISSTLVDGILNVQESVIENTVDFNFDEITDDTQIEEAPNSAHMIDASVDANSSNIIKDTPKTKLNKTRRLENTIAASSELVKIAKKKVEIKEMYYNKKLKLLERDVIAKEGIAAALNQLIN